MAHLRGLPSFLITVVLVFAGLRGLAVVVPLIFHAPPTGRVVLAELSDVSAVTGFAARVPFYRPQSLGVTPRALLAQRYPFPQVVVLWRGERFLRLSEWRGAPAPPLPATTRGLEQRPGVRWWQDGKVVRAVLRTDDLWVEIVTDLPASDLHRLVETLRVPREAH